MSLQRGGALIILIKGDLLFKLKRELKMTRLFKVLVAAAVAMPAVSLAYQLEINGNIYNNESGAPLSVEQVTVEQSQGKIIIHTLPDDTAKVCYDNCSSGPANQAPNITTTSLSVSAGNTQVGTVQASDPDAGNVLTFSLAGGANASLFSITSNGVLSFLAAATQGTYTVNVKVEDNASNSLSDTQAITVTVSAVGSCGTTPANVSINTSFIINWDVSKPNDLLGVTQTGITAIPVHTSSTGDKGNVIFAATASNANVQRTMWISECPGGVPFVPANWDPNHNLAQYFGNKCTVTGSSNKRVRWNLNGDIYPECALEKNTDYYINVQNNTCTVASCNVYLGFTTDH